MIVSHQHRFIFVRTEKTAGSSIEAALAELCAPDDIVTGRGGKGDAARGIASRKPTAGWTRYLPFRTGALRRAAPRHFGLHAHATAAQARAALGEETFGAYFKFAVERNPWDRQVALYHQRKRKHDKARPADFDRDMRSPLYRALHYTHMRNWEIYTIGDRIAVDRVIRYDRLAEDLGEVLESLGLPRDLPLPQHRSGFRPERESYRDFYSDRTRRLVEGWYRREIEAFGFTF